MCSQLTDGPGEGMPSHRYSYILEFKGGVYLCSCSNLLSDSNLVARCGY